MKAIEDWIEIKIRDILASSIPGDWGTDGNPEDGIPVLRSTNFRNNGTIDFSDIAYRKVKESRLDKRRISIGFILIEKSGGSPSQAAGRVVYCDRDFNGTASNFIEVVKVKDEFSSHYVAFLLYYLYQSGLVLKYQQQTTGIINFKLNEYWEEKITCPVSKPEQTKIAEILSTVDRAIEQTEALIAKQQRIKTGLMQDLLTHGIDEHGILRSEQTHKFKDSPLGRIPVEWEVASVSSVLVQPPKNGYSPVESSNWNGTYMLGLGCLTTEGFNPNQLKYAPKTDHRIEAALLRQDDFLISRSNTRALVGLVGIFTDIGEPCIYPDLMVRLKFNREVSIHYMEQVLMSPVIRRQIQNAATGTSGSMVKISAGVIKELLFSKPTLNEQLTILSILQSKAEGIRKTRASLAKLQSLKTALMQDLLTGRKRVTPLLNNPEVLS